MRQGEKGWSLRRNIKKLDIASPVAGEVVEVNWRLVQNPELLSTDPYGEGWLMRVKPKNFTRDIRNLLHGSAAVRWMEESATELRSIFSGNLGLVFQDGGLPLDGLADYLEPEEWNRLVSRILMFQPDTSGT